MTDEERVESLSVRNQARGGALKLLYMILRLSGAQTRALGRCVAGSTYAFAAMRSRVIIHEPPTHTTFDNARYCGAD